MKKKWPKINWASSGFVLLAYTFLTLVLTYPLIFNLTTAIPNDIGDPLLNTWILAWDTHALFADPLNFFNANIFYPLPNTLAYSEHLVSTALPMNPLQLLLGEPVLVYNLALLLTFPLAAFGMYLLTLHWTHHRGAAFVAGLIFAFNPYRFAAIAHVQLLTFQWLPYILLFVDLLLSKKHKRQTPLLLGFAIFLLLQILASWYLAIYTVLIVGIYLAAMLMARQVKLKPFIALLVTSLLVALLILPFALPYLSLVNQLRESRPLSLALSLAAAPTDFFAAAPFNQIFGPLTENLRTRVGFTEENTLFVGIVVGVLALVGVVSAAKHRENRFRVYALLAILIISLLLTFPTPYAFLAHLFPPSTLVRVPPRWIIPAVFALSGLAAFGFAALAKYASRSMQYGLLIIVALLLLAESLSIPLPLAPVENRQTLNPAYHWLAIQPDNLALLELPMHSAPAPEYPEVKRMVASTVGWWKLVNGYSGYTPLRQPQFAQSVSDFPDNESIKSLQEMSTHIDANFMLLVHPGEAPFDRTQWETVDRWRAERTSTLYPVGEFSGDYLYQVQSNASAKFDTPLATFGPNQTIRLLAATIETTDSPLAPRMLLYWQVDTPSDTDLTFFIHLRAADGFVRSQADGPPVSGHYPTTQWLPGEIVQDIHVLPPEDFSQVDHFAVGIYDSATGQRLPAFAPDGSRLADDAIIVR